MLTGVTVGAATGGVGWLGGVEVLTGTAEGVMGLTPAGTAGVAAGIVGVVGAGVAVGEAGLLGAGTAGLPVTGEAGVVGPEGEDGVVVPEGED